MTSPSDVVRAMFEHHLWATEVLIDHLEGLPAGQLDASGPGTYGSMIDTLTHMVDGDTRYLLRLRDPSPPVADDRVGVSLVQLRSEIPEHRERWGGALDDLGGGGLQASVLGGRASPGT